MISWISRNKPDVIVWRHERVPFGPLCLMCLFANMWLIHGCACLPSHLEEIDGQANVFRLRAIESGRAATNEYIKEIRVFEREADAGGAAVRRLCWEIIGYVSAEGFEVVAGQVPEGFQQLFPSRTEVFTPIPGRSYEIAVVTDCPSDNPLGMVTTWVAE